MLILKNWQTLPLERKKQLIAHYGYECGLNEGERERLLEGMVIVERFFIEAHKVAAYRNHYSARTIIEVLRNNSVLEDGDKSFKINDHIVPLLSRISMLMFPALNNLFEIRNKNFKLEG